MVVLEPYIYDQDLFVTSESAHFQFNSSALVFSFEKLEVVCDGRHM